MLISTQLINMCWASLIGYGRAYGRAFANSRATLGHHEDAERQGGRDLPKPGKLVGHK
jgi:hypothetical protein